jgi:hypothetical protein
MQEFAEDYDGGGGGGGGGRACATAWRGWCALCSQRARPLSPGRARAPRPAPRPAPNPQSWPSTSVGTTTAASPRGWSPTAWRSWRGTSRRWSRRWATRGARSWHTTGAAASRGRWAAWGRRWAAEGLGAGGGGRQPASWDASSKGTLTPQPSPQNPLSPQVAGMYGSRLLDRLIVMGLPHVGEYLCPGGGGGLCAGGVVCGGGCGGGGLCAGGAGQHPPNTPGVQPTPLAPLTSPSTSRHQQHQRGLVSDAKVFLHAAVPGVWVFGGGGRKALETAPGALSLAVSAPRRRPDPARPAPHLSSTPLPYSPPHPKPHSPQAPALPEAFLTADGASLADIFFLQQPTGLKNPGAMTAGDVDWYKAALLKPGGSGGGV